MGILHDCKGKCSNSGVALFLRGGDVSFLEGEFQKNRKDIKMI